MQISYDWLLEYLPYKIEIEELSEILTNIGLEVEAVEKMEKIPGNLEGILVGEVMSCIPHPNADKLKLTIVNIGNETLPIVCGAPNVATGQKVLVATVGTKLYPKNTAPLEIKAAKIRGEESKGMLCAEDELGIGESHEGIMVLPEETIVGTKAADFLQLEAPQTVIHIGLTPNRSDAMSHYGVARDITAYLAHHKSEVHKMPFPEEKLLEQNGSLPISIKIEDQERCKRYAGVTIENVSIKESPDWLQKKLIAIDIKPKNNVVDITNYILHDLGQPLHAFDYDRINHQNIIVKTLEDKTSFTTLEDKQIKLTNEDLMICDDEKGLCIAGVMGGKNSSIDENSTNIFLESAWFDPVSIRRTSLHHGIRSEAATHFEKTANIDMVIPALIKAANLIAELGNGNIASDVIDIYPEPKPNQQVSFSYAYIEKLCGKKYGSENIDALLQYLGFEILKKNNEECTILVPNYKSDIHQAADVAEEILRIDGLNNVSTNNQISYALSTNKYNNNRAFREKIANWLSSNGMHEIITNSITNCAYFPEDKNLVKMLNSLTSELNTMRPQLLESGLEVLSFNINRNEKNLALYEIGNTYSNRDNNNYIQSEYLGIWVTGNKTEKDWQQDAHSYDFYYLKGIVESLSLHLGVQSIKKQETNNTIIYQSNKKTYATTFEVEASVLKKFGIKQKVFYAEIDLKALANNIAQNKIVYKELNKYPTVARDLALVLDKEVNYDAIEKITHAAQLKDLVNFRLFDIYEGEKIEENKRSWAINYIFQSNEKTLTDNDVAQSINQLINIYKSKLNAQIRS